MRSQGRGFGCLTFACAYECAKLRSSYRSILSAIYLLGLPSPWILGCHSRKVLLLRHRCLRRQLLSSGFSRTTECYRCFYYLSGTTTTTTTTTCFYLQRRHWRQRQTQKPSGSQIKKLDNFFDQLGRIVVVNNNNNRNRKQEKTISIKFAVLIEKIGSEKTHKDWGTRRVDSRSRIKSLISF